MNCAKWEERIALYAGGDLGGAEAPEVERHLAECLDCREQLAALQDSLAMLREAHGDAIDLAHYAAVRARVLSRIERRPWWRLAWACGVLAAAMLLVWSMRPRPAQRPAPPIVAVMPAPVVEIPVAAPPTAPPHHRHRVRVATQDEAPVQTVMMKIETDNPEVVIYWIAESKGDPK